MRSTLVVSLWLAMTAATLNSVKAEGFCDPLSSIEVIAGFGGTHIGVDFGGNAGDPVYAVADGYVFFYSSSSSGYGGGGGPTCPEVPGQVIFIRHRKANGRYFMAQYGHIRNVPSRLQYTGWNLNGPEVRKGEQIGELAVFAPCRNCSDRCDHLHLGVWDSEAPIPSRRWGYGPTCYGPPTEGCWVNPMTFLRDERPYEDNLMSFEVAVSKINECRSRPGNSTLGNATSSVHKWEKRPSSSKWVYARDYQRGIVVIDVQGGAIKAFAVRTGFWWDARGVGWQQTGGPWGPYKMPLTDEYPSAGGGSRQEFQSGYLLFENNRVTWNGYPSGKNAPGMTASGWNRAISYRFADVVARNGGVTFCGLPDGPVHEYGPYLRQICSGGRFRECWILYDPNNAVGNPQAANEAYLLRTGFLEYYRANGERQAFGCPSRDEFHPETGAPDDAIDFFVRHVGGETQFHYMYYDASAPSDRRVTWHSEYTTSFVSQEPTGQFDMRPGETKIFTVQFRPTGTTAWRNNPHTYPYDYVELKSCDGGGLVMGSFLNHPYDESLGWLNLESPCTMQESTVRPGEIATFRFTGRVPDNAAPGLHRVYFRPNHSLVGEMANWGGMHFQVNVVASPPPPPPPPDNGNLVRNGSFDDPRKCGWGWYLEDPNHRAVFSCGSFGGMVAVSGRGEYYKVQLHQPVSLVKNQWYQFSAKISSNASRTVTVGTINSTSYQGVGLWVDYQLTTEARTYTRLFQATETISNARFSIYLGSSPGTVTIDNVAIFETVLASTCGREEGNLIANAGFECPADGLHPWTLEDHTGRGMLELSQNARSGSRSVKVIPGRAGQYYETQLQQRISVTKNQAYHVRFSSRSATRTWIVVELLDPTTYDCLGLSFAPNLTGDWQTFETTFTATKTLTNARFEFCVGASADPVWFDDIEIRPGTGNARPQGGPAPLALSSQGGAVGFTLDSPGSIRFDVFDVSGRMLSSDERAFGSGTHLYLWNGRSRNGDRLSSGIYFIRVTTPTEAITKKIVVVR